MSPILGIIASQNYPRITNSYESIATISVGAGGSSSISFTSIPSTYKHLQVRAMYMGNSGDWQRMTFNSDTSASYNGHILQGNGSSASADNLGSSLSTNYIWYSITGDTTNPTISIIDILDYADTNKKTTTRHLWGNDKNGSGYVSLLSGLYNKTDAISSITFSPNTGGAVYPQYSHFALYGIRD